ncbi:Fc receptor-like protein 5 isoform X3 [Anguilla anguilla]|uniref:Fc receptor-like protein 5 isoform X3 n=1 Tax=Anguilla anguilla TaxID=7936 RepID=UPI0015AAA07E|nr:Fc receptor-like protein 5 isoform X3 [Anguilla anguilla]
MSLGVGRADLKRSRRGIPPVCLPFPGSSQSQSPHQLLHRPGLRLKMGSLRHIAVTLGFCSLFTVTRGIVLGKPILHAPDVSLAGNIETISCFVSDAPKTEAILYELYQENKAKAFGDYTADDGHAANFTLQAKPDYDGNFFCKASVQNISAVPFTVSDVHYLRVIVPVNGTKLVSDPPLAEVFEGRGLTLTCTVKTGTHVSYQWSHNENPTRMSHHGSSGNRLYVTEATLEDAGNYSCRATNQLNDTQIYSSSDHIFIRVKDSISKPKISLTVHKEDDGYVASVTCRSDKGTPPVNFTFTLLNETGAWQIIREGDPRSASLAVPVTLNRKEGEVRCEAANGDRPVTSDTLTLEVVPVNGTVKLTSNRVGSFSGVAGLALHCEVKRGTFPRYHWFLNDSGLDVRGDFYSIQGDGQTLLLKSVTASSSGFYHCVATDSFDEMNSINSEKLFIDKNGGIVLGKPILHAPDVSLAGDIETISCFVPDAPKTEAILYELYQENKAKAFGDYTAYDGHAANFTLQAKPDYDGNFYCKASVQNISAVPSTISDVHYLRVFVPVEGAELVSDPPLAEVFEGRGLTLTCTVKTGTHVSYQWSHNENSTRMSHHRSSGNRLYVTEATLEDAGNYSCRATNQLNDQIYSSSDHIFIRVKVSVSKPKISLTVHKEDDRYVASVTCRSDKGTPPVNFTFTLQNETRAWQIIREGDPRSASLAVPVTLNRKEGEVRCEAANGDRPVTSDTLTLEVVAVNGTVKLTSNRVGSFSGVAGLALHCEVKRGTFPRYHWFLNDSGLDVRGDFYSIQGDGQTLLLKSITASSSGFYHCVATDSFDEMNSINSEKLFIDKNGLCSLFTVTISVSKPKISLTVHKEDDRYVASVTCRSDKGTPPVNFTFTLQNETRAWQIIREGDPRSASLAVPVTLNRKEGEVRCEAANGDRPVTSDTLTLEVVAVNGTVKLTSNRVGSFSGVAELALHCEVKRGTFPRYHWFLNDSGLDVRGDFYSIQGDGQTLLLKSVTASSSGFYHCVATDSFDEMNSINSEKLFIDKSALAGVSAGVFAVVLSCFLFLLCLLTGCCVYGAIYRRRLSSMKPSPTFISPETDSLESEEEEPVESEYMEDMELVKAANIDYTEKGEEESVDEWPEIERALQISCMDEAVTVI